ncbi:hydroxymethylglutaryl-CoA lyase [Microbaculum marinum]|uniref:Hydroxymethylglutaryl-CoA lyase n=1 Tax=Microbaculum marinum TaxID=1764581 RepID=A0AAW9RQM2_9HYPH
MNLEVKIVEVGPRDGLQNETRSLSLADKERLVAGLVDAGLTEIEAGSFVSPKAVPQMADSGPLLERLPRPAGVRYRALVPNRRGMEAALAAKVDEVAIFASASETFSQRNINCSIAESFARFAPIMEMAGAEGLPVRGYLSCAFGCPYEGAVDIRAVASVTAMLLEAGCYEVAVSDTIGIGTPGDVRRMLADLLTDVPAAKIALHLHDTRGQALANVLAGLDAGVTVFDSSVGGLGGCPYAPGATGNLATEELVFMLEGLGVRTGIDIHKLAVAGEGISRALGRRTSSKVAAAMRAAGEIGRRADTVSSRTAGPADPVGMPAMSDLPS